VVGRFALNSAARALAVWRASVGDVVRRCNRARKVLLRLQHAAEARALASWRAHVVAAKRRRRTAARALARLWHTGVARAFGTWAGAVRAALRRRAYVSREVGVKLMRRGSSRLAASAASGLLSAILLATWVLVAERDRARRRQLEVARRV